MARQLRYSRLSRTEPDGTEYLIFSEDPQVIQLLHRNPKCTFVTWIDGKSAARFHATFKSWRAAKRCFRRLTGLFGIRVNLDGIMEAFTWFPRWRFLIHNNTYRKLTK